MAAHKLELLRLDALTCVHRVFRPRQPSQRGSLFMYRGEVPSSVGQRLRGRIRLVNDGDRLLDQGVAFDVVKPLPEASM